jgi:hypothetical protein
MSLPSRSTLRPGRVVDAPTALAALVTVAVTVLLVGSGFGSDARGGVARAAAAAPVDPSVPESTVPTSPAPPPPVTLPPTPVAAPPFPGLRPVPALPPIDEPDAVSTPLVPNPVGCAEPPTAQVVFVGTVLLDDITTARFRLDQVLAGSADGFEVGGLIDVRYGDEVGFIERGERYVVGAAVDPRTRVLASRISPLAPLFGGDEVAGLDDSDLVCPVIEDPVQTLLADGTPVESGVLSSLDGSGGRIVRAVVLPVGVAFAVLLGLVALKHLVFAVGRAVRDIARPDPFDIGPEVLGPEALDPDDLDPDDLDPDDQPTAVP